MEEEKNSAGEEKEEPQVHCLMTKLSSNPREKTNCTVKQYGSVSQTENPRELILKTVQSEKEENLAITTLYLNLTHQISKTIERVQYTVDSKVEKITSVKIAEVCLTHAQKELFYIKLRQVNFINNTPTHSHLPEFRVTDLACLVRHEADLQDVTIDTK